MDEEYAAGALIVKARADNKGGIYVIAPIYTDLSAASVGECIFCS
jgi:hypothetical protein